MKEVIIKLENVWKIYEMGNVKVNALQGISLHIKKGDFVAVQGKSGSGKSTVLNMVGCLDVPTKGRIFLDKKDISHLSESELAQIRGKKIGFIFQQFNLLPTLTALENVMLPMIFQDVNREKRIEKATKILKMMELGDRLTHRPSELSGGQQQRVAIARSLSNDPDVILADEPTGNLDSTTGKNVIHFLEELNKQGKTIVMVTHDADIAKYAHRIEFLWDGKIIKTKKGAEKLKISGISRKGDGKK